VKEYFSEELTAMSKNYGVDYIGIHPMAGKEKFGFDYAESTLFEGKDFIIVKTGETTENALKTIYSLAEDINAGKITEISPMQHDAIIAYTSQLAHVVSSSYVKSRMLAFVDGFCGGSFQDMTRVAELDEDMWTDLFLMNKDNIMAETKQLTDSLTLFYDALNKGDREKLKDLLKNGRERKEHCKIR
jgi:prephenate dehydrogenase